MKESEKERLGDEGSIPFSLYHLCSRYYRVLYGLMHNMFFLTLLFIPLFSLLELQGEICALVGCWIIEILGSKVGEVDLLY